MELCARIMGVGSYLPDKVVDNYELSKTVDTSDEWIVSRTGIKQRHIASSRETTAFMGYHSATRALQNSGVDKSTIDIIIVATSTPDNTFPSSASLVHQYLELKPNCFAFDISAACCGFIVALETADTYIRSGKAERILVIGSEKFSSLLDWNDRTTAVLFGDGAGAVVLEKQFREQGERKGIIGGKIHTDSGYYDALKSSGGASSNQLVGNVLMNGREVYRNAVNNLGEVIDEVLKANNFKTDDIDLIIPHQANKRIIDSISSRFNLDKTKVIVTVDIHANTSSASIPLALDYANVNKRIKNNDLIILEAFGGGFIWGAIAVCW